MRNIANALIGTRPTAVNLSNALTSIMSDVEKEKTADDILKTLRRRSLALMESDRSICETLGKYGSDLIKPGSRILTHCNTGALATAGIGTAIGVF